VFGVPIFCAALTHGLGWRDVAVQTDPIVPVDTCSVSYTIANVSGSFSASLMFTK
jgi:hypothetical protein